MDTEFEFGFISPLWCTIIKENHLLPWDTCMSFKGCQFTPQLHECISLRDWWELQGCQHCRALALAGDFQVSPQGKRFNLSCLPVFFFFLWRTIRQNFFIQKDLFSHCLVWTKLSLQPFLFLRQWVLMLCTWSCGFYAFFLPVMGKGENEKRTFCLLGLRKPVDNTKREGKGAEVYV